MTVIYMEKIIEVLEVESEKEKFKTFKSFLPPQKFFAPKVEMDISETSSDMKDRIRFWMDEVWVLYEKKGFL